MKAFRELTHQELKFQQPSALKKEYELRADNELVGTLRWPKAFGSLCVAETADGSWTFKRQGFFNLRVTARVAGSEQDVLIYRPNWTGVTGTMEHIDGRVFHLKGPSMWGNRFSLMQKQTHSPLVSAPPSPPAGSLLGAEAGGGRMAETNGTEGEDVELVTVKINFTILHGSADVAIQPKLAQTEDAALFALFSCYLALMAYDDVNGLS
jgi:hypothetical protein